MNFIFSNYPAHPWMPDWVFEPSDCHADFREKCEDRFFRTREIVGRIGPNTGSPEWEIQIPAPQNSRIILLSNGFCAYFEQRKMRCGAELFIPKPGVFLGRFFNIPAPVLAADSMQETDDGDVWKETGSGGVLLTVRDQSFCIMTSHAVPEDARDEADEWLNRDFEELLNGELERRTGAAALFEQVDHHDRLSVLCVETLFKALRPPEGCLHHHWIQASGAERPEMHINELFPVATAWASINPEMAEELLLGALKAQTNSGAIPVTCSPVGTYSVLEAPKPMMAKTVEEVWSVRKNGAFLEPVIPLLRRHLQWMLHHFDPKRSNNYRWKSRSESIAPENFASDLESVDLAVLLLTEIEAFNRIRGQSPRHAMQAPAFEDERTAIEHNILTQFWDDHSSTFSRAFVRDNLIELSGIPSLMPLLWQKLPNTQKSALFDRMRIDEGGSGRHLILNWKPAALEDETFPLYEQFLILQGLKTAAPQGNLISGYARLTLQRFVEWHSTSLELGHLPPLSPSWAAFIINVQSMHQYRYYAKSGAPARMFSFLKRRKVDRTDLVIVAITLLVLYSVHTFYDFRNAPPAFDMLKAELNSAYAEQNGPAVIESSNAIMAFYPEQSALAKLYAGNIMMLNGEFEKAEPLFRDVLKVYPDCPAAMVSLGLALQLQGLYADADPNYSDFCYLFDAIFPQAVREVSKYRRLMLEGFQAPPPRWQEIYRYKFMHELE